MQGLGVSIAKRINRVGGRSGRVFDDRFFARALRTPREVANALNYVLRNDQIHEARMGFISDRTGEPDPFSSAADIAAHDLAAHNRMATRETESAVRDHSCVTSRTGASIDAAEEGPFHPGELEAQLLAGGGPPGAGIRDWMTDQHRAFFEALPYVVVATLDGGWPAATMLAGSPGFVSAPDPYTLRIAAGLDASDPAQRALTPGAPAGLLGIDLSTKRRNRANGIITAAGDHGFTLDVRQSFGNCPQYIHVREVKAVPARVAPPETLPQLDGDARAQIEAADTFFVASAARTAESNGGIDISHRGGPPGFVRVDGSTLTIPDYRGNRYFNTLGNFVSNPRAALLFVDFATGDLLHLQGAVEILWDTSEVRTFLAAQRLWRVRAERVLRRRGALPLRWRLLPYDGRSAR